MFNQQRSLITILLLLTCSSAGFSQTTWYVPDDSPSIQPAFNSSLVVDGDTVIVRPGTYLERLNFKGKAITLKSEMGPAVTVIKGNNWGATVTMETGEGRDSVLEGFTITHMTDIEGTGISLSNASPTIKNCRIRKNKAYYFPGGIDCYYSSPLITDCIIAKNSSDLYEGMGGGLYCMGGTPIIINCEFNENSAERYGGASFTNSNATVTNCTFYKNQGGFFAGGVGCSNSYSVFSDCSFVENRAYSAWPGGTLNGGAMNIYEGQPTLVRCTFIKNSAEQAGAIDLTSSDAIFTNCVFSQNTADKGAGIIVGNSSPTLTNCTFHGNTAALEGSGLFVKPGCDPQVTNSIFWGDPRNEIHSEAGALGSFTYCDIEGGFSGEGNIDQDPLFVDPMNHDLHLTWLSPCINRGTSIGAPAHDLDQDPRPFMGSVDMGADEFTGGLHPLQADAFTAPVTGGVVNFTLDASAAQAGRVYLILGSRSGTAPGLPLPGGLNTLPLNWDAFTDFLLRNLGGAIFANFLGVLNTSGQATAQLNIPAIGPGNIGNLHQFAYALEGAPDWDFASNPVAVEITP